ncbi:MAG: ATP-dependent Clp protease ATP-binding subunit [Gaiellaceae bacterium]
MTDDLGESGRLALEYARRAAEGLGAAALGTEHVFLGVAELEDVALRRPLQERGVDPDEVASALRSRAGHGDGAGGRALEDAKQEAVRLGGTAVEAPHLLIAVLRDGDGLTAQVLREQGADPAVLADDLAGMLERGEWTPGGFYQGRVAVEQPGLASTTQLLESLGRDLTAEAERGELSPIIGRDRELVELIQVLCGRRKQNAVLVGDAGVGKTAIVEALAQRIVAGEVPEQLQGMRIRTIEIGSLVAGTIYRGQFEERLKQLVDEVSERTDVILFLDEMHMLVGAGEVGGGSMDAANMLKPVLAEGKLKVVGATTTDEFRKHIERDKALMRRFQVIVVGEPSREATLQILAGLRGKYADFHGVEISDLALEAAVDLSSRYMHDRFLPDKALDLLDRACTQAKLGSGMTRWMPELAPLDADLVVDADDIAEVVSVLLEIPIATLTSDERDRLLGMEGALRERVAGQDEAVARVSASILSVRMGMGDPDRPYGVFLFLGPTGVGKTKLAEELAAFLFGSRDEVIRLDMSEYMEKHQVSRLIGSPPGYVGWDEGGQLTNSVRAKPYALVLLDEVEKAHPDVWNVFLQVFEDGRLTDSLGRLVDFRHTVIVMTSNVGARRLQPSAPIGFSSGGEKRGLSHEDVKREVDRELHRVFAPEFLNRIDEIVVFRPLAKEALYKIVPALLREMVPVEITLSAEALDLLVEQSYDPAMGARPARRSIQRLVANPLSVLLARGELAPGEPVEVDAVDGALTFASPARV